MTASNIPRYLILTAILAIVVVGVMVSVFFGQYRWLAERLVTSGATQYEIGQAEEFERRASSRLLLIAEGVAVHNGRTGVPFVTTVLELTLVNDADLLGLAFAGEDGSFASAGEIGPPITDDTGQVQFDRIALQKDVMRDGISIGTLYGYFSLAAVQEEAAVFQTMLLEQESDAQRSAFLRIGVVATIVIGLSGALIWSLVGGQSRRLRELK
jgi:hypothetical protein